MRFLALYLARMRLVKKISFLLLFTFFISVAFSQQKKIDSLLNAIKKANSDSGLVNAYRELYYYYNDKDEYSHYKSIGEKVVELGNKNDNDYWKGFGHRVLGDYLHSQQKNEEALRNYLISINFLEKTKEYLSLTSAYTNLGGVYYDVYGPKKAAIYFKKALSIIKQHNIDDISSITNLNNNLGICAASDGNMGLAKFYFTNSLNYWIKERDSISMATGYNNLANVFRESGSMDSALIYFKKALDLKLRFKGNDDIVDAYLNYGGVYYQMKKLDKALIEFGKGEKYVDTTENFTDTRRLYNISALCYEGLKDYKNAFLYIRKANYLLAKKNLELSQTSLARTDVAYSDSLVSAGEKQIAELQIENQNTQLERDKQQKIYLTIGLTIVLIGGILFYNRYKITKKQKEIIEVQKHLVEEQKKEIVDSITYANRIQNAVLTHESVWQTISPQYFVLFKPKDIVSGDFYWAHRAENKYIWAVADCTGHGVPGAFMSMLGNSLLNEIVIENKIHRPSEILNRLRAKIILALTKENVSQNDGMDISLCVWDRSNNMLEFSGANNHVVIIRDGILNKIKGDKMPIGNYHGEEKPFASNEFKLQKNDAIYMYTDGYVDQFGGPKGKKFRYKQLDELLITNYSSDMGLQAKLLEQTFLKWKGELVQTDDICIIGIKVLT